MIPSYSIEFRDKKVVHVISPLRIWWFPIHRATPSPSSISNDGIFHEINHPAIWGTPMAMEPAKTWRHIGGEAMGFTQGQSQAEELGKAIALDATTGKVRGRVR